MKLRNKKTGEIVEVCKICPEPYEARDFDCNSLAELIEEWEDAPEEPSKVIWQIKDSGELQDFEEDDFSDGYIESSKSIGNYFETEEEAEKAVEKLKAWKRLKDKEFEFVGCFKDNTINFEFVGHPLSYDEAEEAEQDLAFLFGGEE